MILVTGAGGFLGGHVVRRAGEGRPERPLRTWVSHSAEKARPPAGAETLAGDLLDPTHLARALAGVEAVVHLASKNIDRDGSGFERVNVEGTRRLARAAAAAGVQRVVYVSTVGVYGHGVHRGSDESTAVAPDTPFSRSKGQAERILLDHHRAGDFVVFILRHRFVYGEGDELVLPRLIRAARKIPFWISGGRARVSIVWAPDLAEVVWRLAADPPPASVGDEPIYHVTDGQPIAYREVVTAICRAFDYPGPRFSVPFWLTYAPVRLLERLLRIDPEKAGASLTSIRLKLAARDNFFSSGKLRRLLPDVEFHTFAEGFRQSLDYYARFR